MRQHIMKNLKQEILSSLKKLNISHNDSLYLSVNMGGVFSSYLNNHGVLDEVLKNKYFYTKYVLKILKNFISKKGSLICPTFSFSTIKTKKFDIKKTKSDLGIFSQVFLNDKNSLRSDHSIHSLSAIGKFKKIIRRGHGSYSFGINSPFDEFINYKVKFLNIGVPFGETCTYTHHVEHLNGCNYRYNKMFKVTKKQKNKSKKSYDFDFVRYRSMSDDVLKNEKIIEEMLKKKKLIEYIKFPIFFSSTSSSSVYDVTKSILKKDSNIFLKGNKIVLFNDNFKNKNLIKLKILKNV
tara:strand:+ start:258 stop:1139 length:882 start_codon:yes stop_codon:yes gene_type:complete